MAAAVATHADRATLHACLGPRLGHGLRAAQGQALVVHVAALVVGMALIAQGLHPSRRLGQQDAGR